MSCALRSAELMPKAFTPYGQSAYAPLQVDLSGAYAPRPANPTVCPTAQNAFLHYVSARMFPWLFLSQPHPRWNLGRAPQSAKLSSTLEAPLPFTHIALQNTKSPLADERRRGRMCNLSQLFCLNISKARTEAAEAVERAALNSLL